MAIMRGQLPQRVELEGNVLPIFLNSGCSMCDLSGIKLQFLSIKRANLAGAGVTQPAPARCICDYNGTVFGSVAFLLFFIVICKRKIFEGLGGQTIPGRMENFLM